MTKIETLISGFPGRCDRGYLGWSGCYLVTTPRGRKLLFDTAGFNEREKLISLLKERGLSPARIDAVILSHLHFDHAANWDLFYDTEILVHQEDLDYALSPQAEAAVLRYAAPVLREHPRLRLVAGSGSVLEDGVQLVHVPGHTPGGMALVCEGAVLCGDALKNRWDLAGQVPMKSWNNELARTAIHKLASLGEKLFPGHDVALQRQGDTWQACGSPAVRVFFPDGSDVLLSPADAQTAGRS